MAIVEVIKNPHPTLRRKAKPVTDFGPDLQEVVENLIDTLHSEPGVGIAAPQINISLRVIVVEYPENDEDEEAEPRQYIVVNPEIIKTSEETVTGPEGCLSVPGLRGDVDRHVEITVRGKSRRGQPMRLKLKDWTARVFQHEIDHLDGILFIDKAENIQEIDPDSDEILLD